MDAKLIILYLLISCIIGLSQYEIRNLAKMKREFDRAAFQLLWGGKRTWRALHQNVEIDP